MYFGTVGVVLYRNVLLVCPLYLWSVPVNNSLYYIFAKGPLILKLGKEHIETGSITSMTQVHYAPCPRSLLGLSTPLYPMPRKNGVT